MAEFLRLNNCTWLPQRRWLPLLEDCGAYMADFQPLSDACESQASELIGKSPSVVAVSGLVTHPAANGEYTIAEDTVGGKAYWVQFDDARQPMYYLYSINEPHDGDAIGD